MKRWKRLSAWAFVLGLTFSLMIAAGCGDDDPVDVGECDASLETGIIITNPLTPSPGDTTLLTIQAVGEGCGNLGKYTWSATGGELVQTSGITVQWVAPMEYGTYQIDCVAKLEGAGSDTSSIMILLREFDYINTGKIVSGKPMIDGATSILFIAENGDVGPRSNEFLGFSVYRYTNGFVSKLTDNGDLDGGGWEFSFNSMESFYIFGSFIEGYYSSHTTPRMNVWRFPTRFGTPLSASADNGGLGFYRKNQHRYPYSNTAGTKVVWNYQFIGEDGAGLEDMFNIVYWDEEMGPGNWHTITTSLDSATVIRGVDTVTEYRYFQNIKPMFTPDENDILYFVDTTGVFEPCIIPMVGGDPDTMQRRAMMIDEDTGIFGQAGIDVDRGTVFQWNPASPFLAFISGGMIAFFDYATESVSWVDGLEDVTEFAWSDDGSQLVAATDVGVFIVSASGLVDNVPIYVKERSTDEIKGIVWNHDLAEPKIAFRLVRKGKSSVDSWSAMIVCDLNSGLWAYGSRTVPWSSQREPGSDIDYTWMRGAFDNDGTGVYMPFPVADAVNYPGKDIILIYSHE